MVRNTQRQRGDTLVEVLMAIVILSMVMVGAITMMSRGLRASQVAVEHTQVRYQLNGQFEMLEYLRDSYSSDPTSPAAQTWLSLFDSIPPYASTTASAYNQSSCTVTTGKRPFYLTQTTGTVNVNLFDQGVTPVTHARAGQGLWIEATRSSGISPAYVDVLIRACWAGVGSSGEQQVVTNIRLYDPAH